MDQIEAIFKNYSKITTIEEYERVEAMTKEDYGSRLSSKEENGYIDIEYHNQIGEYKAKLLLQLFNKHQDFYQYFLKRVKKIVITNDLKSTSHDIINISNEIREISNQDLLKQILNPIEQKNYFDILLRKLDKQENLLVESDCLSYLRKRILNEELKNQRIDFFQFLSLTGGAIMNMDYFHATAIVELTFQSHSYSYLENYMNGLHKEEIELEVMKALHERYGFTLMNQSLEWQKDLLLDYEQQHQDSFLIQNISSLNALFQEQTPELVEKYQIFESSKEKKKISKEEILKLVLEFLQEIDPTGNLVQEIQFNLENGKIMLWNPNDPTKWQEMHKKYSNKFPIDRPLCFKDRNKEEKAPNCIVNVPLTFTVEDVPTIIHEFIHFHNKKINLQKEDNPILREFFSIYFEELATVFLMKKGFSKEKLPVNFRITDSILNFRLVGPILTYLSRYLEVGQVDFSYLKTLITKLQKQITEDYIQKGLSSEEIKQKLTSQGFFDRIEVTIINLIYQLNHLLLIHRESVFEASPYLLGTIMAKSAINHGISPQEMLKIREEFSHIKDPCQLMERVGINLQKYQFISTQPEMKNISSITK